MGMARTTRVSLPSPIFGPMGLETLSPSRAGDYKHCPQLFKFRAIDRLPEPTTIYQARGTTAHLALQRLFDLPRDDRTPEILYDLFREAWSELRTEEEFEGLFASTEEERAWGIESLELLANYFTIEDPTASSVAVAGTATPGTAARRFATRTSPTASSTCSVCEWSWRRSRPGRTSPTRER